MSFTLHEMRPDDHDEVLALWNKCPGVVVGASDDRQSIERYLERNPGLSVVARQDGRLVGAVLCGHDGRRGYLHHLGVDPEARRQGVGRAMVDRCVEGLRQAGIVGAWLVVLADNKAGAEFWRSIGWKHADDCTLFVRKTDPQE